MIQDRPGSRLRQIEAYNRELAGEFCAAVRWNSDIRIVTPHSDGLPPSGLVTVAMPRPWWARRSSGGWPLVGTPQQRWDMSRSDGEWGAPEGVSLFSVLRWRLAACGGVDDFTPGPSHPRAVKEFPVLFSLLAHSRTNR